MTEWDCSTFNRPLSGPVELCDGCTRKPCPEVQITHTGYSERVSSTAAHLDKRKVLKRNHSDRCVVYITPLNRQWSVLLVPLMSMVQVEGSSGWPPVLSLGCWAVPSGPASPQLCDLIIQVTNPLVLGRNTCPKSYLCFCNHKIVDMFSMPNSSKSMFLPRGSLSSICGAGPLKETVTSFRLGSKGTSHWVSWAFSWSDERRWTFMAWTVSSTHLRTLTNGLSTK